MEIGLYLLLTSLSIDSGTKQQQDHQNSGNKSQIKAVRKYCFPSLNFDSLIMYQLKRHL